MNGKLLCVRRQSRGSGGPVIPSTVCSTAQLSPAQNKDVSLRETSAGSKWCLHLSAHTEGKAASSAAEGPETFP